MTCFLLFWDPSLMVSVQRVKTAAVEAQGESIYCGPAPPARSGIAAATSPRLRTSPPAHSENLAPCSHHLPLIGAPFLGVNSGTGGVILYATEKLRSFNASPTRPREST